MFSGDERGFLCLGNWNCVPVVLVSPKKYTLNKKIRRSECSGGCVMLGKSVGLV